MSEEQKDSENNQPVVSEATTDAALDYSLGQLTFSEKEKLSYALFPDTHTSEVSVLGKERSLRPLTIKYSRRVNKCLEDYMERLSKTAVEGSQEASDGVPMEHILKDLFAVIKILAEFYGPDWDDVKEAAASEDISLFDLERAVLAQAHLNTVNDFLLVPLRTLIRMLQLQEIRNVKLESLASMYITLPLQNSGVVPLTS